jgi:hypothetical protein
MLSIGLQWRYINITITILDTIHHPIFYLKHDISETGLSWVTNRISPGYKTLFLLLELWSAKFAFATDSLETGDIGHWCTEMPLEVGDLTIWNVECCRPCAGRTMGLFCGYGNVAYKRETEPSGHNGEMRCCNSRWKGFVAFGSNKHRDSN